MKFNFSKVQNFGKVDNKQKKTIRELSGWLLYLFSKVSLRRWLYLKSKKPLSTY
jgi:hypothetical protein